MLFRNTVTPILTVLLATIGTSEGATTTGTTPYRIAVGTPVPPGTTVETDPDTGDDVPVDYAPGTAGTTTAATLTATFYHEDLTDGAGTTERALSFTYYEKGCFTPFTGFVGDTVATPVASASALLAGNVITLGGGSGGTNVLDADVHFRSTVKWDVQSLADIPEFTTKTFVSATEVDYKIELCLRMGISDMGVGAAEINWAELDIEFTYTLDNGIITDTLVTVGDVDPTTVTLDGGDFTAMAVVCDDADNLGTVPGTPIEICFQPMKNGAATTEVRMTGIDSLVAFLDNSIDNSEPDDIEPQQQLIEDGSFGPVTSAVIVGGTSDIVGDGCYATAYVITTGGTAAAGTPGCQISTFFDTSLFPPIDVPPQTNIISLKGVVSMVIADGTRNRELKVGMTVSDDLQRHLQSSFNLETLTEVTLVGENACHITCFILCIPTVIYCWFLGELEFV